MINAFDLEIAARTVWGEARGEDKLTQTGVAWAIRNRFESGAWYAGRTLAECCTMHTDGSPYGQFSCWNVDDPNYVQMMRVAEADPLLAQCRAIVNYVLGFAAVIGDLPQDVTEGATHYANLASCNPAWVDKATKTVTIGKLTFFKNVA